MQVHDRFVRELPGEPGALERGPHSRQVVGACYSRVMPTPVARPELLLAVPEVIELLGGLPPLEVLAGNALLPGMSPYAACYGGHQFGVWAGQLGDGRAITLGEIGEWELQLKGAGPTPYSRRADGRAVLRSSLRELVASEAMHHLGVPTTRALALVATGEPVMRDMFYDGHAAPEPGAVVSRVARSFLRFGSYEIHNSRGDLDTLRKLVDFTLARHYPGLDVLGLLAEVARRTARLMVEWMRVGFVHGVMNTDNMSILGLTIDYGPFGWLESYDADWTPNTTDAGQRRYRFGNQPHIGWWNVLQLARTLSPLCSDDRAVGEAAAQYPEVFQREYQAMALAKVGLRANDDELMSSLQEVLTVCELDMPLFFRRLAQAERMADLAEAFYEPPDARATAIIEGWLARWLEHAPDRALMDQVNPLYLPRNYLLQEVIDATTAGDRQALPELLEVLRRPYSEQPGRERYAARRPEWARHRAGCSMLSCSS